MTNSAASKLFTAALNRVESKSIRAWAEGQRDVWVQIVQKWTPPEFCKTDEERALRLATYITVRAIEG